MIEVANAFENTTTAFDGPRRGDVVREAGNEHAIQAQRARLAEHLTERPARKPAATRGRAYSVADLSEGVVEVVPQGNSSDYPAIFDDPTG